MSDKKPTNIDEYKKWLINNGVEDLKREQAHYNAVVNRMAADFQVSDFWINLIKNFPEFNDEYLLKTGYPLFPSRDYKPTVVTKPFDSFLLKTFRKNIIENKLFPEEPQEGWVLPSNWFSRINDIIRTLTEVKYLDGVEFLIGKIKKFNEGYNFDFTSFLEAREDGYYAAHIYIKQSFEIPKISWDTERIITCFEIQITTQLQEVIRKLLHKFYEEKRQKSKSKERASTKWQWDYKSDEFSAAYLGHILHYVEGMIMEIRDRQEEKETTR
ncbi:MAG: hypothetical protein ABSA18_10155 [Dehalococcoidia bacterium]|jgi:hypothetical protein